MKFQYLITALLITFGLSAQKESNGVFKTEKVVENQTFGYALHVPKDTKSKMPLIVFLHGSGERGTDVEKVKVHGPFNYLKTNALDAYVLAPQCPDNELWDYDVLYKMILKIQKDNNIDPNRIYITGLSMGGWGTFTMAIKHPEMFAAVVPICGFVNRMDEDDICKIANIPTRIFHGVMDDVVNPENSMEMYRKLKACNANVHLTLFDDANHNSWSRVYDNPEIYEWMLQQNKTNQNKQ